jgi:hypothetical protein
VDRTLAGPERTAILDIALDHRASGLDEIDVAVTDLSAGVVDDATSIGDADLRTLRDLGLSDTRHPGRDPGRRGALLLREDARRARCPPRCEVTANSSPS